VEEDKFYELSRIIVRDIAKILGIELTPAEIKAIGIPHTKVLEAFVHFGNALDANALAKMTPAQRAALLEKLQALKKAAQIAADAKAEEAKDAGKGSCLAYDTLVYMADNSVKRVIDVQVGDMVKARDLKNGEMVSRRVNYKYRADQDHYYMINGELKVTGTHPVLTDNGKWVLVSDLQKGDRIVTLDGKIEITSFEKMKYDHRVYYLGVGDSHNYFVSAYGKNFYLIHNSEGGGGGK
jgi:hypothetical protein